MPLVTEKMGISATGTPCQPSCHIWRETTPCRALTPLAFMEYLRARTVISKTLHSLPSKRPILTRVCQLMPTVWM